MNGHRDGNSTAGSGLTRPRLPSDDPYLAVPVAIRTRLTREQWAFLTDSQRATLVRDFTEPDVYDD
jgi:hypothetical protein